MRNQNINIFFVQAQSTAVPPSGGYRVAGLSVASRDRVQSGKVNAATDGLSAIQPRRTRPDEHSVVYISSGNQRHFAKKKNINRGFVFSAKQNLTEKAAIDCGVQNCGQV